ncbi:hypothetical protein QFZ85_000729 [Pseudomonas frederiksbergensis]
MVNVQIRVLLLSSDDEIDETLEIQFFLLTR